MQRDPAPTWTAPSSTEADVDRSPGPSPKKHWGGQAARNAHGRPRRALSAVFDVSLAMTAVALLALHAAVTVGPALQLDRAGEVSMTVVDRKDALLRAFTTASGHWRLPVPPDEVDQRYLRMLTAFEDSRFWCHGGVDPLAIGRAGLQLVRHGRAVSGASTLSMQTARLLRGPKVKSAATKLGQVVDALQLERQFNKREILAHYLRLAPYGGNMEGVRAASLAYFGKEPRRLSAGEAALLVAIPQSPEARRPDRFPAAAKRARDRVLARAHDAKVITAAELSRALLEPVPTVRREFPKFAPHLAEGMRAKSLQGGANVLDTPTNSVLRTTTSSVLRTTTSSVLRTTLDRDLQGGLEDLARDHARGLGDKLSAAIVVADHRTGEVLARVGSAGYLDATRWGAIDMADAVRSPGSTLKPLIYGLGFETGVAHPETLIEDRPVRFGSYAPKNFDEDFHGTVTVRDALAQSLNIPAVKMLNAVGAGRLMSRLKRSGASPVLPAGTEPTVAIALGGIGLKLDEIAGLYAGLARGGEPVALIHERNATRPGGRAIPPAIGPQSRSVAHTAIGRRILSPVAAWYVTDILKDAPPPAHASGGRIAYKTGTSYGYRDAYAIGYDGSHVIAVWVGRPDSAATPGLSGRTAAAPLLFDAFARLGSHRTPLAGPPAGAIVTSGANLPPPLKRFQEPGADAAPARAAYLEPSPVIAFPPDRSEVELAETGDGESVTLKVDGGALPLTWLVDNEPIASEPYRREVEWRPAGRGFARVSVIDANGKADRVIVRVR